MLPATVTATAARAVINKKISSLQVMILEKTRAVSSLDEACATFLGPVRLNPYSTRTVP